MARKKRLSDDVDSGINPHRTADLFALTADGYIIAQDTASQKEYIAAQRCENCGHEIKAIAHINRSFQGLNEVVAACTNCRKPHTFIFDISNDVYQAWWAGVMGEAYIRAFDDLPRVADRKRKKRR
jgi:hypothetical protein